VAILIDTVVIGAPQSYNVSETGSVYIFTRSGTAWMEKSKITASDGAARDHFGHNVSISGDNVVAGSYGNDDWRGSAYICDLTQ